MVRARWLPLALVATLGCECVPAPTDALYACAADGSCPEGLSCRESDRLCVPGEPDGGAGFDGGVDGGADGGLDGCVPAQCQPGQCGTVENGCGGTLECGGCASPLSCGAQEPNRCGCPTIVPGADGEADCYDGVDDDCDGLADCADEEDCLAKPCSDESACTTGETCVLGGICSGGTVPPCNSSPGPCHLSAGVCNPRTGQCEYGPKDAGAPCADEGNPCTDDWCDGQGACAHPAKANGTSCNDGLGCTGPDSCQDGACSGPTACSMPPPGECWDSNGTCTPTGCQYAKKDAGTACTDDGNPCTYDVCDNGSCTHPGKPNDTACSDGLGCTGGDKCQNGTCVGQSLCGSPPGECWNPAGTCTSTGCTYTQKATGTACTDDGEFCTNDVCNDGGCTHPAKANGTGCSDGRSCTSNDACQGGTCTGTNTCTSPPGECWSSLGTCTVSGCSYSWRTGPCADDGNPCTNDTCSSGVCSHPNKVNGASCGSNVLIDCGSTTVNSNRCRQCQSGVCTLNSPAYNTACKPSCAEVNTMCPGSYACVGSGGITCGDAYDCTCCQ